MLDRNGVSRVAWNRTQVVESSHGTQQGCATIDHLPFLAISRSLGTSLIRKGYSVSIPIAGLVRYIVRV